MECRYSWIINDKVYYTRMVYTMEYYRKYIE